LDGKNGAKVGSIPARKSMSGGGESQKGKHRKGRSGILMSNRSTCGKGENYCELKDNRKVRLPCVRKEHFSPRGDETRGWGGGGTIRKKFAGGGAKSYRKTVIPWQKDRGGRDLGGGFEREGSNAETIARRRNLWESEDKDYLES